MSATQPFKDAQKTVLGCKTMLDVRLLYAVILDRVTHRHSNGGLSHNLLDA